MRRFEIRVLFFAEDAAHASDLSLVTLDLFPEGSEAAVMVREIPEEQENNNR